VALASLIIGPMARAQTADTALAEALFRSARTLVAAGNYAEACPKFAESQRIDPKLGTLLNLALCHAKQGKTASAWGEYTEAAQLASRAHQAERERVARQGASELEAVLAHVILRAATTDPVDVTWDGKTMSSAVLGTALPVDPGTHQLVASAAGRTAFTQTVTVPPGPTEQTITIPTLELATPLAVPPAPPPPLPQVEVAYGHPLLGYSLLGGGAVAIVTGSIFGALALGKKSAADGLCGPVYCYSESALNAAKSDVSKLQAYEATSTITIGAGLLAAGAGLYFVLRSGKRMEAAPDASPSARIEPMVGPGSRGVALSGTF
jgi:tetratricopeptide (TPR) repeat protein